MIHVINNSWSFPPFFSLFFSPSLINRNHLRIIGNLSRNCRPPSLQYPPLPFLLSANFFFPPFAFLFFSKRSGLLRAFHGKKKCNKPLSPSKTVLSIFFFSWCAPFPLLKKASFKWVLRTPGTQKYFLLAPSLRAIALFLLHLEGFPLRCQENNPTNFASLLLTLFFSKIPPLLFLPRH